MKVSLNKMYLVANWNWTLADNDNDHCTICMNPFECPCPQCKIPGEQCPPIKGECGHIFHLHCIYKWLDSGNEKCPLDRETWKLKTEFIGNYKRNSLSQQDINNSFNRNNNNFSNSNEIQSDQRQNSSSSSRRNNISNNDDFVISRFNS